MMEVVSVRTNASSAVSPFDLMTAILKGGNIDLSSSSKFGVSMPPSLAMFLENRELLLLLTTSVSPQNLAIFEASESLRSFNSVCFTVSNMEFEGFGLRNLDKYRAFMSVSVGSQTAANDFFFSDKSRAFKVLAGDLRSVVGLLRLLGFYAYREDTYGVLEQHCKGFCCKYSRQA